MMHVSDFVRYSAWASKKLLDFARTVPDEDVSRAIPNSHGGILKTFQHIYYADRVWLNRLEKNSASGFEDPAPGPSLADMDIAWWPLLERITSMAERTDPATVTTFQRMNGEAYSLPFGDIVMHVANHGTYHRGQIASMLRQSGHVPPSTDLLFYSLGL